MLAKFELDFIEGQLRAPNHRCRYWRGWCLVSCWLENSKQPSYHNLIITQDFVESTFFDVLVSLFVEFQPRVHTVIRDKNLAELLVRSHVCKKIADKALRNNQ